MRTMTPWDSNMWDGCREKNDIWDWPDYSLQQLRGPFREKISSMGEFTDNRPHIPMNGFGRMEMDLCFSSVQLLSCVQLFAIPWTAAHQVSLSIASFWSLLKLMFIESVMPSNYHILCCPLLLLLSIFPSIRDFSNESVLCIRWPKYWSFSFSISPSNEYSGLISFRIDWILRRLVDLLAIQGTLKSLLQHHSSTASVLWCSAFFIVQLSHPYMTKTITLTIQTFVGKVTRHFVLIQSDDYFMVA